MPQCAICLNREANQTGSHMLSAFMIESTIGKRGEEKAYVIDDEPNFDYRNNSGAAPVVEDHIFCSGCEKRMSYIEGYICADYRGKLKDPAFRQNFTDTQIPGYPGFIREANRINPYAFTLLVMSLLLRISLSTKLFLDFELRPDEQESLRAILDEALPTYENFKVKVRLRNYLKELNSKANLFSSFHYVFATYEKLENTTTAFNIVHPEFRFPYNIMLGETVLLIFFEKPLKTSKPLDYFELLEGNDITTFLNGEDLPIRTLIIDEEKWSAMIKVRRDEQVDRKMRNIRKKFISDFIGANKRFPGETDWQAFVAANFP